MELKNQGFNANRGFLSRLLQWVNLRPEEVERTWMMFAFYTTVAVGLRWAEDSTVALFLDQYGAGQLPWIYIASAALGAGLVGLFSWLQRIFPLRWVIVGIVPCMIVPLFLLVLLRWGISIPSVSMIIIFLLRLWVDACYVVTDLNASIVANQLFNIREIKRTYPLVSSGLLVADVISGFSLPWLVKIMSLNQVIIMACLVVLCGSVILFLLTYKYRGAFPSKPQRDIPEEQGSRHRRLQTPLKRYVWYLFIFVALLQVMGLLIDFQYLRELNSNFGNQDLASFLGLFGGIVGVCELFTQWFVSSRLIEKIGVFSTAALLPITVGFLLPSAIALLSFFPAIQAQTVFWGLVSLKFCDELLRYTFVVSSGPVLYQPIPEEIRSWIQTLSGGTAEAISSGLTGIAIFITLFFVEQYVPTSLQKWVFVGETVIIAASCLKVVWELRSRYVDLLVLSAERGEVSAATVGLRVFQQGVVKALVETGNAADKGACVELLAQIDLQGAAQVLAPLLGQLPPDLQSKSLEVMLLAGANPAYTNAVSPLLEQSPEAFEPEVFALALRYIWLADPNPDLSLLEKYLHPQHHSLIRATAAALLLRQGTTQQRIAATDTMRGMLTHPQEQERINAVKAFRESVDLQELQIYIPNLLKDQSLRVRCAVLEMIAATRLEEYYPTLLAALYYKSTRTTAIRSLVRLENEGLHLLLQLATNIYKPEVVRMHAWRTIAQIGTVEAQESLWLNLDTSWGSTREYILRSLIKILQQSENNHVGDKLDETRIEALIKEEVRFLGEIYAAYIDLEMINSLDHHHSHERLIAIGELLQTALLEVEIDVKDRLLLLLKLLYSPAKIQAASLNLQSESVVSLSRGLEILDHTVKLASKSILLHILDRRSPYEKLQYLIDNGIVEREKRPGINEQESTIIANRLRKLIMLGNLLSDWCLACCFHFAQAAHIRVSSDEIVATLRHPTGFVREAAISYLSVVSGQVIQEILPYLKTDPHPLVAAQVQELMKKSGRC
ncbi:Npt1/Npt2 family nucleotide transporter [Anabaena sp. UHCC 0204]|uniref:Npt1/Npt2 family nucleotide transporter n=1 Tax=Anabaena sp. UHCC 0204 TaxID=2590009 RepID=UPI001444BE33|nr:Npt1/Npt2 family nucleotide transporter [Anabaena sp. UHCC 0204]MTJ07357.1 MFS transporter [Anabaena sp. UHCC 0204]